MLLRMIFDDKLAECAYLIGCQRTGEAIVIDPERDVDRYVSLASREGLRISAVAETHVHADFLSGARELAEATGCRVHISGAGGPEWTCQWLDRKSGGGSYDHRILAHGDVFSVGGIELKVLHTPGHTPEHVCYLVTDRAGGADAPIGIISGDFLFVGDLGRPDLLETAVGRSGTGAASARELWKSVRLLDSLPEWLQVWPAHGAGSACGKALGAVPQSTIGYERRFNPAVRAGATEDGFIRYILDGQPEPPAYFARMKRENVRGPKVLGQLPRPRSLGLDELRSIDASRVTLIDTRPWNAFRSGHVPGSLFHPVNGSFTTDAGSMVPEDEAIYLVAEPAAVDEAVRALVRVGLDDIRGYCEPRVLAELAASGGRTVPTAEVPADTAAPLVEKRGTLVLDVRRATEFGAGRIPGAINISHTRLPARLAELPRDRAILVNCKSGGRSARACALLQRHGFDVTNLAGGFDAWAKLGGRVER